jgi:hypothetical protein
MPYTIEYIDAIARKKKRDVIYLEFTNGNVPSDAEMSPLDMPSVNWRELPIRKTIIEWLDANKIEWDLCGHFASTRVMASYRGQIYIDIPFDPGLPAYQTLAEFLELPDGTGRFPGVGFHYLPLDVAMQNAHHDEPGFWEKWADGF